MKEVVVSHPIRVACTEFAGAVISCKVVNSESHPELWKEIDELAAHYADNHKVEDINKRIQIAATRKVYKSLGKDPNRYRPSAEALCRRIIKEKSLYRINTLVDLINLVSISSGFSIGGFDEDKIIGTMLTLGVGEAGEVFHGIGRGALNIEGLPVYRDSSGGIGTPTSDDERTKLTIGTTNLLMIINGYSGQAGLQECIDMSVDLLKKYASAHEIMTNKF